MRRPLPSARTASAFVAIVLTLVALVALVGCGRADLLDYAASVESGRSVDAAGDGGASGGDGGPGASDGAAVDGTIRADGAAADGATDGAAADGASDGAARDGEASDGAIDGAARDGASDGSTPLDAGVDGAVTLVSLDVSPAVARVALGTVMQLAATGVYSDGTTRDLTSSATWTSDVVKVASVASGLVTPVAAGSANVTAAALGLTATSQVTVPSASVVSIAVTPATSTIGVGGTIAFAATATLSDGTTEDVTTPSATWTSANAAIAAVASTGIATGVGAGTTTVTATVGAVSGGATISVTSAALVSLAITPTNPTLARDVTQPFAATATYADGTTADVTGTVTWSSSAPATLTIDASGLGVAGAAGTSIVTATSSGISATTTVTVTDATVTSIDVAPATGTVAIGGTVALTATARFSDGSTLDVTSTAGWTSSDATVAAVANGAGTQGIVTGLAAGSAVISVTLDGVTGTANVTVTAAALVSIAVAPASATVPVGASLTLTATGTYADGSVIDVSNDVTWTVDQAATASVGNADGSRGRVQGLATGTTEVRATLGAISGAASVVVSGATLASIAVTPANPSIAVGDKQTMTATATYSDGTTLDVTTTATWSTGDAAVATVSNASGAQGLLTAVDAGATQVTATVGAISGSTTATVTASTLAQIVVSPVAPSHAIGDTVQFTAMAVYSNGTQRNVTAAATWTSSLTTVATIGATGTATAIAAGKSTIVATYDGLSGSTYIDVTGATVTAVEVSPVAPTVAVASGLTFRATAIYDDGTSKDVTASATWSSSDTSVISFTGARVAVATAVASGTAVVTATWSGFAGTTTVTVSSAVVVSIAVSPGAVSDAAGTVRTFQAAAIYSDGTSRDVSLQATWLSSASTVVGVNDSGATKGEATALTAGTATISATWSGVTGSATFTVTAATITEVEVTPIASSVAKGTPVLFAATAIYSDGTSLAVTQSATWTSSDAAIATVNTSGTTRGRSQTLGVGTVTISATYGGVTGATTLTVTSATLTAIQITPFAATVPVGFSTQLTATGVYSDETTTDLTRLATWTSSAASVAGVSDSGATKGLLDPLGAGTATISASYGGVTGNDAVTVSSATLASIAVTPATSTLVPYASESLVATGTLSDGSTLDVTTYVTWLSTTDAIVSVSNAAGSQGAAKALSAGTATVTAIRSGISGTASITVN